MKSQWVPFIDNRELAQTVVVIPTFKNNHLTWEVVRDCLRENVQIFVVDNGGDYQPIAAESVLQPGANLGWLRGNNLAINTLMQDETCKRIVMLNNDIRLSDRFFAGLVWAEQDTDAGIVASSYDSQTTFTAQHPEGLANGETLEAHLYVAKPLNIPMTICDGTAFSVKRAIFNKIGILDQDRFGKYGWGASVDLCIRASIAGFKTVATRAAYVHHIGSKTALQLLGNSYLTLASLEYQEGMKEKWGSRWRKLLDPSCDIQ